MNDLMPHRSVLARIIRDHKFERTDDGRIYVPSHKLFIGGAYVTSVNGGDRQVDPNIVVNEQLDDALLVLLAGGTQKTAWYMMPFSQNVTPGASITAANFNSSLTEVTAYTESNRVQWVPNGTGVSGHALSNSLAPSRFTINATQAVWGMGMSSQATKLSGAGILFGATKFAAVRNLLNTDKLDVEYAITASSS